MYKRQFQDYPRVTTLSVHAASNFPLRKVDGDIDIPLADGTSDDDYLAAIADRLPDALDTIAPGLGALQRGRRPPSR